MQANIDAYNAMLPNVEAEYRARGFDVSLHDVNADARFETSDFWIWGIHFNTTGFQKMAARCTHHRTSNRTSQERLETALTANGLRRLDSRGVVQLAQGPQRLGADATGARSRTASSASGGVIGWDCDGLRRRGENGVAGRWRRYAVSSFRAAPRIEDDGIAMRDVLWLQACPGVRAAGSPLFTAV
jgi:hypothetical protein